MHAHVKAYREEFKLLGCGPGKGDLGDQGDGDLPDVDLKIIDEESLEVAREGASTVVLQSTHVVHRSLLLRLAWSDSLWSALPRRPHSLKASCRDSHEASRSGSLEKILKLTRRLPVVYTCVRTQVKEFTTLGWSCG